MFDYRSLDKSSARKWKKKKKHGPLWMIVISIFFMVLVFAMLILILTNQSEANTSTSELSVQKKGSLTEVFEEEEQTQEDAIGEKARANVATMNVSAKAAQLMMTTPEELTEYKVAVAAGTATKERLKEYPVGGLLYTGRNFENQDQMKMMLNNTKIYSRFPLFLVLDLECKTKVENTNQEWSEIGANVDGSEGYIYQSGSGETIDLMERLKIEEATPETVIEKLQGGADLVIVKKDFVQAYQKIVEGIRTGELSETLVEDALIRVQEVKLR